MNLEGSSIFMSISEINSSKFTPEASELPNHGFLYRLTVLGTSFLNVKQELKANQKVVGYHHNTCTIIAPIDISCPAYHLSLLQFTRFPTG